MKELIITIRVKNFDKWGESEKTEEGLEILKDEISMELDNLLNQDDYTITMEQQNEK